MLETEVSYITFHAAVIEVTTGQFVAQSHHSSIKQNHTVALVSSVAADVLLKELDILTVCN